MIVFHYKSHNSQMKEFMIGKEWSEWMQSAECLVAGESVSGSGILITIVIFQVDNAFNMLFHLCSILDLQHIIKSLDHHVFQTVV